MFYRRKIILALLQLLSGEVEKLRLQKLLFLYAMKKQEPEYDFVPYKFGCYSYSAKADLSTMVGKGHLKETEKQYYLPDSRDYLKSLKPQDQVLLQDVVKTYGSMSSNSLIRHTYINFPFYAINSSIAKDVLPEQLYTRVENAKPKQINKTLFTIGYEGCSLEKYLQKLIKNNVKLLVDVRRNPLSMKFGFSKTSLKKYCESVGINYVHIPEVGIESNKRQSLETQNDYDLLFEDYRSTTLKRTIDSQFLILDLLNKHKRIALTCFEAEPCQCHRTHLAVSISKLPAFDSDIAHL